MTRDELTRNDGREGRRALVAVNGKIYDFTDSPLWSGGEHESRHAAGNDLSEELKQAPHVRAVIERFPVVATLEEESPEERKRSLPIIISLGLMAALFVFYLLLR